MRSPSRAIGRWWLVRKLPADLCSGDICFIPSKDGDYTVIKILAIDKSAVHVRHYRERFAQIPRFLNTAILTLGKIDDENHGIGHLPLSRATFASWLPFRTQHEEVAEDELAGYRLWKEMKGGIWG